MENIELEFVLEKERRYLLKNPFKGRDLAIVQRLAPRDRSIQISKKQSIRYVVQK